LCRGFESLLRYQHSGAGGIGRCLANEIQQAEWPRVAFLILMILATVGIIDRLSSRLLTEMPQV